MRLGRVETTRCRRTKKIRFRFRIDALIALEKRQRKDKGEQRAYECEFCHGWHLTSQPARIRAAVTSERSEQHDDAQGGSDG